MLKENLIKSTIPNGLTLFRCLTALLLPLIVIYGGEIGAIVATPLLILAGMTDYFDGFFARKYKVISNFGKILDPIADKLLVAAVILILTSKGVIKDWDTVPALIILLREITVSGLREYLAGIKVSIPVSRIAKLKTFLQLSALAILILSESTVDLTLILYLGKIFLWLAGILTLYTAYDLSLIHI